MDIAEDVKGDDELTELAASLARKTGYISLDSPDKITRGWFLRMARAILAERERCAKLLEEGYERPVATPYRDEGIRTKHDRCLHGRYMYEDCEACAAIVIRSGASTPRPMTGFLATLTPEQRERALVPFDGDETLGEERT